MGKDLYEMTTAGELMALDKQLRQELPETFREGMHLVQLYAVAHQKHALNEINAFRLIRDAEDSPLDTELILSVYRALTEDTEAECREWKPRNCHVKCGDGFYIPATWEETPTAMEALCRKYRYLGERPEDIAETILFLASEQARMLTGQVIKVSGGHAL